VTKTELLVLAIPLYVLSAFLLFIPIYCYLHEFAGHYLVNWLSGISAQQMEIIWVSFHDTKLFPIGITPVNVTFPYICKFAGGFIAGLILLLLSILFWRLFKKKGKELYWWFFAATVAFSCAGFTEFIIEGFFPTYHRASIETAILLFFIIALPIILAIFSYKAKIISFKNIV